MLCNQLQNAATTLLQTTRGVATGSWLSSSPTGESEALPEGFCIIESRDSVKVRRPIVTSAARCCHLLQSWGHHGHDKSTLRCATVRSHQPDAATLRRTSRRCSCQRSGTTSRRGATASSC